MKRIIYAGKCLVIISTIFFFSCEEFADPAPKDYYPIDKKIRYYLRESYIPPYKKGEVYSTDTIRVVFERDSLVNGRSYAVKEFYSKFVTYDLVVREDKQVMSFVRKDGSKCIEHPLYNDATEYVFLDWAKANGDTWTYSSYFNDEFKSVRSVVNGLSRTVNGRRYDDVIMVEERGYYRGIGGREYEHYYTARRWFALDIGEIDSSFEYYYYTSGLRLSLLPI